MRNIFQSSVAYLNCSIFEREIEYTFNIIEGDLVISPNAEAVIKYVATTPVDWTLNIQDLFELKRSPLTCLWHGDNPPSSFLKFQEEWNRWIKMKAFW
jgi:hypothetical protein